MKDVKYILGCIRRADQKYKMIEEGDRVLIGVSGGKDSIMLLYALNLYRFFSPNKFELFATTVTMGLKPIDTQIIANECEKLNVPYIIKATNIGKVVFENRKEKNPCALCSKMRRGSMSVVAKELNCNKIALGHHRDDVIETFFMSLIFEGRLKTFSPLTWLDRAAVVQIRPMIFIPEKRIISTVRSLKLPIQNSPCPAAGKTARESIKGLLKEINHKYPGANEQMISAIAKTDNYDLWDSIKYRDK